MFKNEQHIAIEALNKCFKDDLEAVRGDKPYLLSDFEVKLYTVLTKNSSILDTSYELQLHILYKPYDFSYMSTCPVPIETFVNGSYSAIWAWFRDVSTEIIEKLDEIRKNYKFYSEDTTSQ